MKAVTEYGFVIPHVTFVGQVSDARPGAGTEEPHDWGFNVYLTGGHVVWAGMCNKPALAEMRRKDLVDDVKAYWAEMKPIGPREWVGGPR